MNSDSLETLINEAKKKQEEYNKVEVKCGIIGMSGSGKSSLINSIAGEKIAPVGSTEQTMEAQSFHHSGIEFVDLPGCGTERWPQSTYIRDLRLESYDCFIIVTNNRLYEPDLFLYKEMSTVRNKPCFIVRNKIDIAIQDENHDNNLSEEETLIKIRNNIKSGIPSSKKIYLTSTRHPTKWDFPSLLEDIASSQYGIKQDKFIAGMAAWSKKAIDKKRTVAEKIVGWSAVASAANGLNPIPGLDVSVDAGVLINMVSQINKIYGLTEEQLAYIEKTTPGIIGTPEYAGLKQGILKLIAKYAATEGIILILKRMGAKVAVKNISKYIPIIGQIISAGIGYSMTLSFGESYLDEVEDKANALLDELVAAA